MQIIPTPLYVIAGTNLQADLAITDHNNTPLDLTSATLELELAPAPGREPALTLTSPSIQTTGSPTAGLITINAPPEETRLLTGWHDRWQWRAIADYGVGQRVAIAGGPLMRASELAP